MRRFRAVSGVALVGGLVIAAAVTTTGADAAAPTTTVTFKPTGSVLVTASGNGHGHGLSQYGAYGAALSGLTTPEILTHYYPGTALASVPTGSFRVLLSGTSTTTTVWATPDLKVTGVDGALPATGISRYRLVADAGSTLTLQKISTTAGSTWTTVRTKLANSSQFSRPAGAPIRLQRTDGSTYYYGYLRAVRASATGTAGGVRTVDVVGYNAYAQAVAPREMPASWSPAAVAAQAVAARSYAMYEKQHAGSSYYDICDTSMCQVYGGHQHLTTSGAVAWNDDPAAVKGNANQVLTYQGSAIFAQYSASNGGYTSAGGQPYLRAASDKYDPGKSGDPYIKNTTTLTVKALAADLGLSTVSKIVLTRDGNGTWGGRVVTATVYGSGSQQTTLSGDSLGWEFGFGTTLYTVAAA